MPYSIIQVEPRGYILADDKGNLYNHTPHSKKQCQQQIKAIEASKHSLKKVKGGGGTFSKVADPFRIYDLFHEYFWSSVWWFFPVKVEICEINNVIFDKFKTFAVAKLNEVYGPHPGLVGAQPHPTPDNKIFFYTPLHASEEALRSPYRILFRTVGGAYGAIAIQDKRDFETLQNEILDMTTDPTAAPETYFANQSPPKSDESSEGYYVEMHRPAYKLKKPRKYLKKTTGTQSDVVEPPRAPALLPTPHLLAPPSAHPLSRQQSFPPGASTPRTPFLTPRTPRK